ncbi:MAG TPA: polysaccharide deacetylase family protein [Gaiellaceae bacterium]|jgi:peptidoglycan/xylan/chitin deacetylase (PgdA/CDA1 family)|nr:polysaccharide deacetylase family protein [Gaiellaceae bacterium]
MVLCYHAVSDRWPDPLAVPPSTLERHLRSLVASGFRPADLATAARVGRALHVTFDDAYRSVLRAIPMLDRLRLPATVFACSALAETGAPLAVPELERRSAGYEDELATLDWEGLRALTERGIEIGSHTVTHPHLTQLSDGELARELEESRDAVAASLGRPCPYVAYPYGEHDLRVRRAASAAGYTAAFGLGGDVEHLPAYGLPRVDLYRRDGLVRLALKVSRLPLRRVVRARRGRGHR